MHKAGFYIIAKPNLCWIKWHKQINSSLISSWAKDKLHKACAKFWLLHDNELGFKSFYWIGSEKVNSSISFYYTVLKWCILINLWWIANAKHITHWQWHRHRHLGIHLGSRWPWNATHIYTWHLNIGTLYWDVNSHI